MLEKKDAYFDYYYEGYYKESFPGTKMLLGSPFVFLGMGRVLPGTPDFVPGNILAPGKGNIVPNSFCLANPPAPSPFAQPTSV